jgi:CBS domain-containing protein
VLGLARRQFSAEVELALEGSFNSIPRIWPIVADGLLVGIVTDRDIALRVVAGRDPDRTPEEEVASPDPHYASPDESLDDAYERMAAFGRATRSARRLFS